MLGPKIEETRYVSPRWFAKRIVPQPFVEVKNRLLNFRRILRDDQQTAQSSKSYCLLVMHRYDQLVLFDITTVNYPKV